MKNVQYEIGDMVRVQAHAKHEWPHGIPSGAVCEVVGLAGWGYSDPTRLLVRIQYTKGGSLEQAVRRTSIRPARQAMRKRAQYMNRRG